MAKSEPHKYNLKEKITKSMVTKSTLEIAQLYKAKTSFGITRVVSCAPKKQWPFAKYKVQTKKKKSNYEWKELLSLGVVSEV